MKNNKNKRKQRDRQILGSCQTAVNAMEREGDTNCNWCPWKSSQKVGKKTGGNSKSEKELS